MSYNATDREQIEELKQWWNDYGRAITIAVIIGLLIGFGWRYWNRYQTGRHDAASQIYLQMMNSTMAKQSGVVNQYAMQLKKQYSSSPYAAYGSMMQAKADVEKKNYKSALTNLDWVIKNSSVSAFQEMARIREARVLIQEKQYARAKTVLATVNDKDFQPAIAIVNSQLKEAQKS